MDLVLEIMSPPGFRKRSRWLALTTAATVWLGPGPSGVTALGIHRQHSTLQSSYDYIIAGGGLTGLVVANRLSENPNVTVLIVEYGDFDDTWNTAMPYYANGGQHASLLFSPNSIPQRHLNNRTQTLTLGATVGGGSTVNGMAVTRGQRGDYDAWEELGNSGWGWSEIFKYWKKATSLNLPDNQTVSKYGYKFNRDAYGNGPWQNTFPPYQFPDIYTFQAGWKSLGYSLRDDDGSNGTVLGVHWRPTGTDGKNLTRSSARKAYYDPAAGRPNLDILVNNYVAKINIRRDDDNARAVGVDIISRSNSTRLTITAKREVILAAGAIHTPQILQLSGIGPSSLLNKLNITVVKDLPGVGANLQDHPALGLRYDFKTPPPDGRWTLTPANATLFSSALAEYLANRTGPMTVAHGSQRAMLSLQNLTSSASYPDLLSAINPSESSDSLFEFLPEIYKLHPPLLAGYRSQLSAQKRIISSGGAIFEFVWTLTGTTGILDKSLSRGTVLIKSATNAHPDRGMPDVDFGTWGHGFDRAVSVLAVKMARRHMAADAVLEWGPMEAAPGVGVVSDAEIEDSLRNELLKSTNAHPCCTAALGKEEQGGVVDGKLRVHGVRGLRVVDASVMPLVPVAHLQATMYAISEKAADLIKADW